MFLLRISYCTFKFSNKVGDCLLAQVKKAHQSLDINLGPFFNLSLFFTRFIVKQVKKRLITKNN